MKLTEPLPNVLEINGREYSIETDFKKWMKFEIAVSKRQKQIDIRFLFANEYPAYCKVDDLLKFSRPQKELPRPMHGSSDVEVIDFEIDANLIYAAFLQQYGIDLLTAEMHWHVFLALIDGLTGTRLDEVMAYRCYQKDTRKGVDRYEELRRAWEIEPTMTEEEKEELEEFSNQFY